MRVMCKPGSVGDLGGQPPRSTRPKADRPQGGPKADPTPRRTLHFSHHVEHHLFPAIPSCHYPMVRRVLLRHVPERYLAPWHFDALRMLYSTPRLYDQEGGLSDPINGRSARISEIESSLRNVTVFPFQLRERRQ